MSLEGGSGLPSGFCLGPAGSQVSSFLTGILSQYLVSSPSSESDDTLLAAVRVAAMEQVEW